MEMKKLQEHQIFDENRFTKVDIIKTRNSVSFVLNFLPGQEMKAHNHPNKELYLLVLQGNGTFSIDGELVQVKEGDVLFCEAEEKLGFVNTSDGRVSVYATMSKTTN